MIAAQWKAIPVFVTSTFRDMHAERDYLRARVFPELDERLRERRLYLEPIDLRWGVDTLSAAQEHAKELEVLKVCLAEVERSRPFLVGILGDRYGWEPPAERIEFAAREVGLQTSVAGKSLTELEIEFGVLAAHGRPPRCLFYFRDPLPYERMPAEVAARYSDRHGGTHAGASAADKLAALKGRIRARFPDRVRQYRAAWDVGADTVGGLDAWGRQVLEDLWRELDAESGERVRQQAPSWQDEERWTLEQFLHGRARGFVGREAVLDELVKHARAPAGGTQTWGVCLTGPAGAGKSALVASLADRLADRGLCVLTHAAGISLRSQQVDAVLRRWVGELGARLGDAEVLPDDAKEDAVERAFATLLERASAQERVVVLVDALDQLEPTPRARYCTWLPTVWPANARLVATAIAGTASEALCARDGMEGRALDPLSEGEAAEIVRTICARYHRAISPPVLAALLDRRRADGAPAASNPLWLELAVEELNLLDADDFARAERVYTGSSEEQLHALLLSTACELPADVPSLYGWLLARAEQLHGRAWTEAFFSAMALSGAGWREADMRALVPALSGDPWDALAFAAFRRTFRAHVVQRGAAAQWDFSHAQLRLAARDRYLADPATARALHGHIAGHLVRLPADDPLHVNETMMHLIGADDRAGAAEYYGGDRTKDEAEGATRALVAHIIAGSGASADAHLGWVESLLEQPSHDADRPYQLARRFNLLLDPALKFDVPLDVRLRLLRAAERCLVGLTGRDAANVEWQRELALGRDHIGDVLRELGDLFGARQAYDAARAAIEHAIELSPANLGWQYDLFVSRRAAGTLLKVQGDLAGALRMFKAARAAASRLVAFEPANPLWQGSLATTYDDVGGVMADQGDLPGARRAHRSARAGFLRLTANDPTNTEWRRDLAVAETALGDVLRHLGDRDGARAAFETARAICQRLADEDPASLRWQRDLAIAHQRLGSLLNAQQRPEDARRAYEAAHVAAERLTVRDPMNPQWHSLLAVNYQLLGDILQDQGDLGGARAAFDALLAVSSRLAALDPSHATWQSDLALAHQRLGLLLQGQGDLAGARRALEEAGAILAAAVGQHPANADLEYSAALNDGKVGSVRELQGDFTAARRAYDAAHAVFARLADHDVANLTWQHDLAVTYRKRAELARRTGDLAGARQLYEALLAHVERVIARGASDRAWMGALALAHDTVGGLLRDQGYRAAAHRSFEALLAVCRGAAAAAPTDAEWQRNLAVAHVRMAELADESSHPVLAAEHWRECRDVLQRMQASGVPLDPMLAALAARLLRARAEPLRVPTAPELKFLERDGLLASAERSFRRGDWEAATMMYRRLLDGGGVPASQLIPRLAACLFNQPHATPARLAVELQPLIDQLTACGEHAAARAIRDQLSQRATAAAAAPRKRPWWARWT